MKTFGILSDSIWVIFGVKIEILAENKEIDAHIEAKVKGRFLGLDFDMRSALELSHTLCTCNSVWSDIEVLIKVLGLGS